MPKQPIFSLSNTTAPAWLTLNNLHKKNGNYMAPKLREFLASLEAPHDFTEDSLMQGAKRFAALANTPNKHRAAQLGNKFYGLHYSDALIKQWNLHNQHNPLEFHHAHKVAPTEWQSLLIDGYFLLQYRGNNPAQALDRLLCGPTVIDCGMFCQLSIWFGIRYILGNEQFNKVFGRQPISISQTLYNKCHKPTEPHLGNPQYPFFSTEKKSKLSIRHIPNYKLYSMKHPGGLAGGHNTLYFCEEESLTLFDPSLPQTSELTQEAILHQLLHAYNSKPDISDQTKLTIYKKKKPGEVHAKFGIKFSELTAFAEGLKDHTVTLQELKESPAPHAAPVFFDFQKFTAYIKQSLTEFTALTQQPSHEPLAEKKLLHHTVFAQHIAVENQQMCFDRYEESSPLHTRLKKIGLQFCHNVISGHSAAVILSGNAGIGKTSIAIACAKELISRDINVLWCSEMAVTKLADQAASMAEVGQIKETIKKWFASMPQVVIIDDNNISGYCGEKLLKVAYEYYVSHPGTALLITANNPINLSQIAFHDDAYNKLGSPHINYDQPAFHNFRVYHNLKGVSQRLSLSERDITMCDQEKIECLLSNTETPKATAIIVSEATYHHNKESLPEHEHIPNFSEELLVLLRNEDHAKKTSQYYQMSEAQKMWLKIQEVQPKNPSFLLSPHLAPARGIKRQVIVRNFHHTEAALIALDIDNIPTPRISSFKYSDQFKQIVIVINYCHEHGKNLMLINKSGMPHSALIDLIKQSFDAKEQARLTSRLDDMLSLGSIKKFSISSESPAILTGAAAPSAGVFRHCSSLTASKRPNRATSISAAIASKGHQKCSKKDAHFGGFKPGFLL